MLIFEDIAELPAGRLGAALEGVASEDIAVALRAAAEETKGKILSALSSDASRRLREEMERIGPVRLSEVEAAQQRVAQAVRDADAGRYVSAEAQERRQLLA
jgi:flagellar motor switch protein FliG